MMYVAIIQNSFIATPQNQDALATSQAELAAPMGGREGNCASSDV